MNLQQIIKSPTRITDSSRSLIDVILVSSPTLVKTSGVMNKSISDHLPVFMILKLKLPKPPSCSLIARSYRNYNSSTYAADLAQLTGYFSNLQNNFPKINDHLGAFNNAFSEQPCNKKSFHTLCQRRNKTSHEKA